MSIKRIFTLTEYDDEPLAGQITSFDEAGKNTGTVSVDLSQFPANIVSAFFGVDDKPAEPPTPVEEIEPPLRGHLPDGFPGKAALEAADAGTYAKVRALIAKGDKWWDEVDGVGEATAKKIEEAV